ncbi:thioredoxin family protein [Niveibacterium sp. SC-1]|uniref:thioredoxin family protein n=1 Tax=Niveibacterium sp. SC-1 TaxID=3135646 RepID=UPI00311E377C
MASTVPPVCDFGTPAPEFALPGTDGRIHTLSGSRGARGLLVMFICNHCPYVKAVLERIERDARDLQALGIGVVAISANDAVQYPEDGFEAMKQLAQARGFSFPYLFDETQAVALAYGAVCTPDFFGYNADLQLQYRGRLDASRKETAPADARRDLFLAMEEVARSGRGPAEQIASMGCSIKWKAA